MIVRMTFGKARGLSTQARPSHGKCFADEQAIECQPVDNSEEVHRKIFWLLPDFNIEQNLELELLFLNGS